MAYQEIDLQLNDEQKAMRDVARKFGAEVIRPAGIALDKLDDPAAVVVKDSALWEVFRQYRKIGFHRRGIPTELGGDGVDVDPLASILIGEELGYWDAGLAVSLAAANMPFVMCSLIASPVAEKMARDFTQDEDGKMIGCWAITEPNHGSDWALGKDNPACGPSVKAVKKGDRYIINGEKSAWVSNGTIATHAVLHVGLDPSRGMLGNGMAIIPLDLPGISRGKPINKLGQRPLNQGSISFDEVMIPEEYMIVSDSAVMDMLAEQIIAFANGSMGVAFAGLARAAFDEAFKYASQRIQGGVPVIEHQNIRLKLFKMFNAVEAARSLARSTSLFNSYALTHPTEGLLASVAHSVASKVLSTETATMVASEAIQILGGYGLTKEYPVEKMFRDARASMIEDGVNEALALTAMDVLVRHY